MKLIFLLFLTVACATNKNVPTSQLSTYSSPEQVEVKYPSALFHTEVNTLWAQDLAKVANCVFNNASFRKAVEAKTSFDMSDKTGAGVYASMQEVTCGIRLYATKNPFSKAIATTYSTDKYFIYLNTRRNPRDMPSMVNTVIHECSHIAGFSHGSNSPVGKENTVPYWIGKEAESYVSECI